jgi:hypothetical protein
VRRYAAGASVACAAMAWVMAASPAAAVCSGDCDGDGQILVSELVTAVGIALGDQPLTACQAADGNGDATVGIAELIGAVTNALNGCSADPTPTVPSPAVPTPTSSPVPTSANQDPPTSGGLLVQWLEAGSYFGWAAESAPHPSAGPHFGTVHVFVNDRLLGSLESGQASHPAGAATVKELYGSGNAVLGWSVMVKVEGDSDEGRGWYWFERFNGTNFANGRGVAGCTGCHSAGRDFVQTEFPLQ